LVSEPCCS
jgi:hypothetical protein